MLDRQDPLLKLQMNNSLFAFTICVFITITCGDFTDSSFLRLGPDAFFKVEISLKGVSTSECDQLRGKTAETHTFLPQGKKVLQLYIYYQYLLESAGFHRSKLIDILETHLYLPLSSKTTLHPLSESASQVLPAYGVICCWR